MPYQKRTHTNFPLDGIQTFVTADGLLDFIKQLEKDFFAEVFVKCQYHTEEEKTDIILDLHCNFGLTEGLHHFNSGNWGGFTGYSEQESIKLSFETAFGQLSANNNSTIDIAELSLHFKDTSIIVTRLEDRSIPEQLGSIINAVSEHFVYFTKGLTEMPYEIFVPVFEGSSPQKGLDFEAGARNYFKHWGLYFENDPNHDVMVYTLDGKEMRKEDFFLLD